MRQTLVGRLGDAGANIDSADQSASDECQVGSSLRGSSGSPVTTPVPDRRAQTTTWASAMSLVPLAARRRPTSVASTPSRGATWVRGCRGSQAWQEGSRIA